VGGLLFSTKRVFFTLGLELGILLGLRGRLFWGTNIFFIPLGEGELFFKHRISPYFGFHALWAAKKGFRRRFPTEGFLNLAFKLSPVKVPTGVWF